MARHFVRLKLRLIAHRIRRSGVWSMVGLILTWLLGARGGLLFGLLSYLGVRLVRPSVVGGDLGRAEHSLGGWTSRHRWRRRDRRTSPLRAPPDSSTTAGHGHAGCGGDRARGSGHRLDRLGRGVRVPSVFGIGLPIQLLAGAVMVLWCLGLSRLVTSALSDLLRSRRGRELMALIGPMIALTAVLFSQFAQRIAMKRPSW